MKLFRNLMNGLGWISEIPAVYFWSLWILWAVLLVCLIAGDSR
jgi:hypothetical protein